MTGDHLRKVLDLRQAQREGEAGLARRREARFASLLAHARGASPFYRDLYRGLPAGPVALGDLPPVNKPALMAAFDGWATDPRITKAGVDAFMADPARIGAPFLGDYFVCTSAGTTGHPGVFVYDRQAVAVCRALTSARITPSWVGLGGMLRMARRGFRWACVVGTGGHYAGAGWIELERRRSRWRSRAYRVFSVQQPLAELVAALETFDPAMVTAYPSALALLAQEQAAGRLHLHPTLVEIGGESTTREANAFAAAAFGCPVHDMYSASEFMTMAFGCTHGWLHVNSDWVLLEPVDEQMRPAPPGQASHTVLLTNLANRVQPLIRYDLGDSIRVRPDACPCGNTLPAIQVVGRRDDVLRLAGRDGQRVAIVPLAIGSVVDGTPGVHRAQIVQTSPTSLRIRIECEAGREKEAVWRAAAANLHAFLAAQGLDHVEVIQAPEPPQQKAPFGKFRQVIAA
jgi:phenylacetate-coenzyme A ligase PaaK-like adenylate-forming protein